MHERQTEIDISDWEAVADAEEIEAEAGKALMTRPKQKAATTPAFEFVAVGDLELKAPEFIVDGWLEANSFGVVFGPPGCGKTFLALDWALCVASGREFHGASVKTGPVFYIAGEGYQGIARRAHAWAQHHEVPLQNLPFFMSRRAAQFLDKDGAAAVANAVAELAEEYGAPVLIEVDTLARNFGPGDENDTAAMSAFVAAMDDLRAVWNCTVAIVHHTGHENTNRARGSIALKGACDFEYGVAKKGRGLLEVSCAKMKDAPEREPALFGLESVELGAAGSSAVLAAATAVSDEPEPTKLSKDGRLAREAFIAAAVEAGNFNDEAASWSLHFEDWKPAFHSRHTGDKEDTKRKAFLRGRNALIDAGLMTVCDDTYTSSDDAICWGISMQRDQRDVPGQL